MNKPLLYKAFKLEAKDLSEDGTFEGYASTFGGPPDSYGDVVNKGAFAKTLKDRKGKIRLLAQHDPSRPIGVIQEIREDDHGLWMKAKFTLGATDGADYYHLLKDGAVDSMSIGFYIIKHEQDNVSGIRYLNEISLWEVSLVTFPANEYATVSAVKSRTDLLNSISTLTEEDSVEVVKFIRALEDRKVREAEEAEAATAALKSLHEEIVQAAHPAAEAEEAVVTALKSLHEQLSIK